ncbi:MAG: hypothetical protein RLZZ427_928 [Pseudomonadota bacterium]|jgi:hypothetical protein
MVFHIAKTTRRAALAVAFLTAAAALPGSAYAAGSSTGSGEAALTVEHQCSITGADVDLGTYRTTQTWRDVGAALGVLPLGPQFVPGARGLEYLNYGSVTCDADAQYSFTIIGNGYYGIIGLPTNAGIVNFYPMVSRIGEIKAPDTSIVFPGAGAFAGNGVAGTGTGSEQKIIGSAILSQGALNNDGYQVLDLDLPLGGAGSFQDQLSYTLNF